MCRLASYVVTMREKPGNLRISKPAERLVQCSTNAIHESEVATMNL